jgi:hypothetical protein
MNKIVRNKDNGYSVINNHCLRNKNISEKAKGVFAIIMSLPDNWDFSINGLVTICNGGESAIRSAIKELISNGYCQRNVIKHPITKRIIDWEYIFSEKPLCSFPQVEEPQVESPHLENHTQLNKDESIPNKKSKEGLREPFDYTSFMLFWNTTFIDTKIKRVVDISEKRKKAINAVLKVFSKDDIRLVVNKVKDSRFANGENDRGWVVTFDWLFILGNFTKVLEGNYDNKKATSNSKSIFG